MAGVRGERRRAIQDAVIESVRFVARAYAVGDRADVRRLALACADRRVLPACLAKHSEWVADVLTRYYTDFEPQSGLVAVDPGGTVVGYLLGSRSTARRDRVVAWRILPRVVLCAVASGGLLMCPWPRLALDGLRSRRAGRRDERVLRGSFPAHLHLGVDLGFRGCGVGRTLVERFATETARAGVPGINASVLLPNDAGRAFFAACGFRELGHGQTRLPGSRSPVSTILFGRALSSPPTEATRS